MAAREDLERTKREMQAQEEKIAALNEEVEKLRGQVNTYRAEEAEQAVRIRGESEIVL